MKKKEKNPPNHRNRLVVAYVSIYHQVYTVWEDDIFLAYGTVLLHL